MSDPIDRESDIFNEALEIESPEARSAYLSKECGDDLELRERVEVLLKAYEAASGFIPDRHASSNEAQSFAASAQFTEKPGDVIGRYKLLEKLGEGGMGVVYLAEQREPVRRQVALKIIKVGMDTRQVVARFEAERQALAMMDHPNIAKVLDGGETSSGRPYFVMELVSGIPITRFCDEHHLRPKERLELFAQVCHAVQHAHQKGIIHRDLKPANILITPQDPDKLAMPKIIDFGIAKATGFRLTDKTLFTAFAQMLGTPAYMSPEQAGLSPGASGDIDTRSDIFSLGVLLYELLTGRPPFETADLLRAGLDEMRRIIRETEPAKPSTRLTALAEDDLSKVAVLRQSDPPKLISLVRGDLDWIVMKALEKDRNRRYETANGLAMDIQHYLSNEPIVARPPSNIYRFQMLARRHKLVFAAGASVFAALVIGLAISTFFFFRERREHKRAVEAAKDALAAGLESFRLASAMSRLSGGAFNWAKKFSTLEKVAGGWPRERIRRELHDRPELQAELLYFLSHSETAWFVQGFSNPSFMETFSTVETAEGYVSESRLTLRSSLLRESLSLYRKVYGSDHPFVAEVLNDLASNARGTTPKEAEEHARTALAMRKKLFGPHALEVAESLVTLGNVFTRRGRHDPGKTNETAIAEAIYLEALAIRTNNFRPEVFDVAQLYTLLAEVQERKGDLDAAEQSLRHAALCGGNWSADNFGFNWRLDLVSLLRKKGSLLEAEEQCRQALTISKALKEFPDSPADSPASPIRVATVLDKLVLVLSEEGKLAEAEVHARECLDLSRRSDPQGVTTFRRQSKLGDVLLGQKNLVEAELHLISGYEGLKGHQAEVPDLINPHLKQACERLVQLYIAWDKPAQASEWQRKWADLERASKPKPNAAS